MPTIDTIKALVRGRCVKERQAAKASSTMDALSSAFDTVGRKLSDNASGISVADVSETARRSAKLFSDSVCSGMKKVSDFFIDNAGDRDELMRKHRRARAEFDSRPIRRRRILSSPEISSSRDLGRMREFVGSTGRKYSSQPLNSNGASKQSLVPGTLRNSEMLSASRSRSNTTSSAESRRVRIPSFVSDSGFSSTLESTPERASEEKDGKLFISSEYSSDDKKLFVFVTQCGNVTRLEKVKNVYITFRQIYFGRESKKKTKKIKHDRHVDDFRYSHTYAVPFKTFDHMNYSGITVLVKLKTGGIFSRKTTIRTLKLRLHDVEIDPVSREDKLFF